MGHDDDNKYYRYNIKMPTNTPIKKEYPKTKKEWKDRYIRKLSSYIGIKAARCCYAAMGGDVDYSEMPEDLALTELSYMREDSD